VTRERPSSPRLPGRPCPVCGDTGREVLFEQRFLAPEEAAALDGYRVCVCAACGFGYADGVPAQAKLDAFYRERSKYEHAHRGGHEPPHDRARLEATSARFARLVPDRASRVLELGCATGGFLAMLRGRGYVSVVGVDPSPACAAAARALHDVDVRPVPVSAFAGERFDVAVLLSVLEHVRDLHPLLEDVSAALAPGGSVYVQVPDVVRFADHDGAPFQQFSTEHINYFSRASLGRLMAAAGFVEEDWEEDVCEEAPGISTPLGEGLYRRAEGGGAAARDVAARAALGAYVDRSRAEERRLEAVLGGIATRGEPVIAWGAGTLAQHLLARGALAGVNVAAFVDANPHLQGRTLAGAPIVAPSALRGRTEPILVLSRNHQDDIVAAIRGPLGLTNPVTTLYPLRGAAASR
jgi:SAM-dependent methyltransferase